MFNKKTFLALGLLSSVAMDPALGMDSALPERENDGSLEVTYKNQTPPLGSDTPNSTGVATEKSEISLLKFSEDPLGLSQDADSKASKEEFIKQYNLSIRNLNSLNPQNFIPLLDKSIVDLTVDEFLKELMTREERIRKNTKGLHRHQMNLKNTIVGQNQALWFQYTQMCAMYEELEKAKEQSDQDARNIQKKYGKEQNNRIKGENTASSLEQQLKDANRVIGEKSEIIKRYRESESELNKTIQDFQDTKEELEGQNERLKKLVKIDPKDLESLSEKNDNIAQNNLALQSENEELKKQLSALLNENTALKSSLQGVNEKHQPLIEDFNTLAKKFEEVSGLFDLTRQERDNLLTERGLYETVKSENEGLVKKLQEMETLFKRIEDEGKKYQADNDTLTKKINGLENVKKDLEPQIKKLKEESEKNKKRVQELQNQITIKNSEINILKGKNLKEEDLEKLSTAERKEIERLNIEKDALAAKIEELKEMLQRTEKEKNSFMEKALESRAVDIKYHQLRDIVLDGSRGLKASLEAIRSYSQRKSESENDFNSELKRRYKTFAEECVKFFNNKTLVELRKEENYWGDKFGK